MCEASSTFLFDFAFLGSVTRVSASDFHVQRSDQKHQRFGLEREHAQRVWRGGHLRAQSGKEQVQ